MYVLLVNKSLDWVPWSERYTNTRMDSAIRVFQRSPTRPQLVPKLICELGTSKWGNLMKLRSKLGQLQVGLPNRTLEVDSKTPTSTSTWCLNLIPLTRCIGTDLVNRTFIKVWEISQLIPTYGWYTEKLWGKLARNWAYFENRHSKTKPQSEPQSDQNWG